MREKFVSETLSLGGTSDESCDIDKFDGRGDYPFCMDGIAESIQAWIIHIHPTDIRIDGTKREIRSLGSVGARESIK